MKGMHLHIYPLEKHISSFRPRNRASFNLVKYLFSYFVIVAIVMDSTDSCGPSRMGRGRYTKKIKPLVFGEHRPNSGENSLEASGQPEGRIRQNDSRFRALETNYNEDIDFMDLEGNGASRMMTKRLKEKLNALAISVLNQWPKIKLTVRRGWSESYSDGPNSLHYEGRAVDVLTQDRNRSKMGLLAALAVQVGFDWVHYEKKGYIHCSVRSESSLSGRPGTGCFTGDSTVRTRDGPKQLSQVQVGEEILSMDLETGAMEYSPLMFFLDRQPNTKHLYVHIKTSSGQKIKLTPSHLIMRWEKLRTDLSNFTLPFSYNAVPTYAKNIRPNDKLIINKNNRMELDRVDSVQFGYEEGMFAPLTVMGTVVVDNVVASCYAVLNDHYLAHIAFLPYRMFYSIDRSFNRFVHAVSGLWSPSLKSTPNPNSTHHVTNSKAESKQFGQVGIHWYAKFLSSIAKFIIPSSMMYQH